MLGSLPSVTRWIVAVTVAAGSVAAGLTAFSEPFTGMTGWQWSVAAVILMFDAAAWIKPLVLYRTGHSQAFHFDEGFLVALAVVEPPRVTIAVIAAALLIGQMVIRRPAIKSLFNLGEAMLATSAALLVSRAIEAPNGRVTIGPVLAACIGASVYFAVSTGAVTLLMYSLGARLRELVMTDLDVQLIMAGSATLIGAVLALDLQLDRWSAALAVPTLVVLRQLVSSRFGSEHDRARMQGLFTVTLEANRRLHHDAVLESVLEAAQDQLRCTSALITAREPGPGEMATPIEVEGKQQWLTVSGRPREEPFDRADQLLLDAIAAIAKGAFTNAELYRQVRYERGRLASVTLNIGEGVCAVDADGNLTFANPAAAEMVRLPSRLVEVNDHLPSDAMRAPEFLLAPARAVMIAGNVQREEDACFEGRDGQPVPVAYTASAVRHNGKVVGAVIAFRDVTERKKLEAIMARQALHDSLTGLPNRRMLVDRLERALERSQFDRKVHALIFVDVDRFKAINDSLGHGNGDALLVAVANRLRQAVGARALVARFGGDEFVILVEDLRRPEEAVEVAQQVCQTMAEPLVLANGYELVSSLSLGIALTEPDQTADDALRDADVAMYRAKGRGSSYELFDRSVMGIRSSERIDLESALRKGIERGELEVYYQPIVSVVDQRVVGAEGLVRWRHPVEGLLLPDRFVPMAEETGLILPIGKFVLGEACRQIAAVRRQLGLELPISVNLSPRQFQQSSLLADLGSALAEADLPPHLLKFEITETMVMDDLAGATEIMKRLSGLGVQLAIDDFGTGHSSLGYVKRFPVQEIKVDRMFVQNLAHSAVDAAIVRAVVDLADAMGISAVAEGVETVGQLECLEKIGCHRAQGYLFSRPIPGEDLIALLGRQPAQPEGQKAGRPTSARLRVV